MIQAWEERSPALWTGLCGFDLTVLFSLDPLSSVLSFSF
jgi:hypothetical protein